jgi:hypothetical protein
MYNLKEERCTLAHGFSDHGGEGMAEQRSSHHGGQEAGKRMVALELSPLSPFIHSGPPAYYAAHNSRQVFLP